MQENEKNNEKSSLFSSIKNRFGEKIDKLRDGYRSFMEKSTKDKLKAVYDFFARNAMFIIIFIAIIVISIIEPRFLSVASIVNIISLTAAKLPIALGIGGAIVLSGTDISAGRMVGLTACIAASLLQSTGYANKMFPSIAGLPIPLVILAVMAGFAKFLPIPPNSPLTTTMANTLPKAACHKGMETGRFKASKRPVTQAERSPTKTFVFIIFCHIFLQFIKRYFEESSIKPVFLYKE